MIEKIYSTLDTFEEIKLHKGLNILLADITKKSTDKDTRNGLGKTTFIEIIHFYLEEVVLIIASLSFLCLKTTFLLWIIA